MSLIPTFENQSVSIEQIRVQVTSLIAAGLSSSAGILCNFLLTSSSNGRSPYFQCSILELQADALLAHKDYKRALSIYRQALRTRVGLNQQQNSQAINRGGRLISIETFDEAQLKFKVIKLLMSFCYVFSG